MKRSQQTAMRLGAIGLAVSALALGLVACSGSDAAAPVEVVTTPPVAVLTSVAKYQLVLRNAATGALITDPTTVSLSGVNMVNLTGAATTNLTVTDGLASFATAPGVAAGGSINIAAQSRAAGWNDGAITVNVSASTEVQVITLRLVNTQRVAEIPATAPIAAAAASVAVASGATSAAISASTPPKTLTGVTGAVSTLGAATVNIAAGTRVTNAAGQTPAGGLTLSIITPSLDTNDGAAQVPVAAGAATNPVVVNGAITTVLQDSSGNRFTNFGSPVKVQMPLRAGVQKDDFSGPLAVGDSVGISVWNPSNSSWVPSNTARVVQGPNGLVAEFDTSSFSTRASLVPLPPAPRLPPNSCISTVSVTRPAGNTQVVNAAFNSASLVNFAAVGATLGPLTVIGSNGSLQFTDANGNVLASLNNSAICNNPTVALQFAAAPTGSVVVSTREQCASGTNNRALPNVQVAAVTSNLTRSGSSDANGSSTIAALPAGTYSVTPSAMTGRTTPAPQTVTVGAGASNVNFVYLSQCAIGTGGG